MKLLTKENERSLPALGSQDGKGGEVIVRVKFFDPCGSWTWYAIEYDPEARVFFGVVDGFEKEYGYFSLDELESVTNRMGLHLERDKFFTPKPLRECVPEVDFGSGLPYRGSKTKIRYSLI